MTGGANAPDRVLYQTAAATKVGAGRTASGDGRLGRVVRRPALQRCRQERQRDPTPAVDLVAHTLRTQLAAIIGNAGLAVPMAILFGGIKARGVDFRQRLRLGHAIAWHLLTHPREFFLPPRQ